MTDLVQRLRDHAYLTDYPPANAAADEIEHLRKVEEAARNLLSVKGRHHTEQAYKRLEDALK
jgi:hypothetical protein